MIKRKAGATIAQQIDTCVYPNLVQCAIEQGVVDFLVNESDISTTINMLISNVSHTEA
jgi:chemotaxis response regulator CheB